MKYLGLSITILAALIMTKHHKKSNKVEKHSKYMKKNFI